MYLVESFEKQETKVLKTFYIEGTNKDVIMRRAKERLGLRGVKCRVISEDDTTTLIPNRMTIKIKIKEV